MCAPCSRWVPFPPPNLLIRRCNEVSTLERVGISIGSQLYNVAKGLDPTRLVINADGLSIIYDSTIG